MVIPAIMVNEPKIDAVVVIAQVIAVVQVAPVQSTLLPSRGISAVTVWEVPNALSMKTLSCGSGTRDVQFPDADQFPEDALVQCWSAAVVKVIPEFPPQSPDELVACAVKSQLAAPAAVISCQSVHAVTMVPAENVLAVPMAEDCSITRLTTEFPFTVSVPVIVWLPENVCI